MIELLKPNRWMVANGLVLAAILLLALLTLALGSCSSPDCRCRKSEPGADMAGWCSLTPSQLQERRMVVKRDLVPLIEVAEETPSGFTFRFPTDRSTVTHVLDFVQVESACCNEFGFEITLEPGGGPVWLRIRAIGEGKEALREELIQMGVVSRQ